MMGIIQRDDCAPKSYFKTGFSISTNYAFDLRRRENNKKLYVMDDYLYYIPPLLIARKLLGDIYISL